MSDSTDFLHADDFVQGHAYDFDPVYFIADYEITKESEKAFRIKGESHSRNYPLSTVEIWLPKKAIMFHGKTAYIKSFFHKAYEDKLKDIRKTGAK